MTAETQDFGLQVVQWWLNNPWNHLSKEAQFCLYAIGQGAVLSVLKSDSAAANAALVESFHLVEGFPKYSIIQHSG